MALRAGDGGQEQDADGAGTQQRGEVRVPAVLLHEQGERDARVGGTLREKEAKFRRESGGGLLTDTEGTRNRGWFAPTDTEETQNRGWFAYTDTHKKRKTFSTHQIGNPTQETFTRADRAAADDLRAVAVQVAF